MSGAGVRGGPAAPGAGPRLVADASAYTYEVRRLVERGRRIAPNGVWTYGAMAEAVGREVHGGTATVQTALRRLARDHGIEFRNLRRLGYQRLDDAGIVEMAPRDRAGIRRRIARASRRSANIADWDALSEDQKRAADSQRTMLAVLGHCFKPASLRRLDRAVGEAKDALDLEATLALFAPGARGKR